jgi:hypothetical protein
MIPTGGVLEIIFYLWTYGPMALWPYGPMALWPYGPMDLWPYGPEGPYPVKEVKHYI